MSINQDVELRGTSITIPLRIITNEDNEIVYREQTGDGADLLDPQDGIRFVDKFDTWHLGGFVKRFVENGWYNGGVNIHCLRPGEIKPAARRIQYTTLDCTGANLEQFSLGGLHHQGTRVNAIVHYEGNLSDNIPTRVRWFSFSDSSRNPLSGNNEEITNGGAGNDVGDVVGSVAGYKDRPPSPRFCDGPGAYL